MRIAINAFTNVQDLYSYCILDATPDFFEDIIDFISNHQSEEYMSFKIDNILIRTGTYHSLRRTLNMGDLVSYGYTKQVEEFKFSDKHIPTIAKLYANRNSCYFYAEKDGVVFQTDDITTDIIKEWCMEKANV